MKVNLIVIVPGCAKSIADNSDSAVDVNYVYNQKNIIRFIPWKNHVRGAEHAIFIIP
jgi:hypothetical protein